MSPPGTFVSGPQATRDAALFTDLYELTMAASYLREGMNGRATFSLFVRKLPKGRAVLADAGMKTARCAFLAGASMSSNEVRRILDRAGLDDVKIFVSGGLDEESMDRPIRRSPRFAITVRRRSPPCRREFAGSGTPPEEIVAPPRVRRRQKTAHVQVRKGTTLLQTGHGPRVARAAKTPKVKKR